MAFKRAALAVFLSLWTSVSLGSEKESSSYFSDLLLNTSFNPSFWHLSGSVPAVHFNDEGDPYRLSLGMGYAVVPYDLILLTNVVYSYYDVNAVADNNPSSDIEGGSSHSLGVDLALRKSFSTAKNINYYYEGGGGFQYMVSKPPFPADGSDENFTLFLGSGIVVPAGSKKRVTASVQWFHISNANLFPDNSGYDGLQLVIGFERSL
ncbi:hypothetical protein R50073_36650 [Maricurvus nonylphenolicus]|uniref:acyloxyacyl hydrolase n=1 Tax=Maricurvus nonylphenolicus TaxID=1008307 RepID=UPI0036F30BB4